MENNSLKRSDRPCKMGEIRPKKNRKIFSRKSNEDFDLFFDFSKKNRKFSKNQKNDFSKLSLNFRENIFQEIVGRICTIFEECHRV